MPPNAFVLPHGGGFIKQNGDWKVSSIGCLGLKEGCNNSDLSSIEMHSY